MELAKRRDGAVVLRCVRTDGSATWQRQEGTKASFFPFHDLTHYAVETTLGARRGFFGLIAEGWEIGDTGGKGVRGPLPPEAVIVEHLVGLFTHERVGGARWSAADFAGELASLAAARRIAFAPPLTDGDVARVRALMDSLHDRWAYLPEDQALVLPFDRGEGLAA